MASNKLESHPFPPSPGFYLLCTYKALWMDRVFIEASGVLHINELSARKERKSVGQNLDPLIWRLTDQRTAPPPPPLPSDPQGGAVPAAPAAAAAPDDECAPAASFPVPYPTPLARSLGGSRRWGGGVGSKGGGTSCFRRDVEWDTVSSGQIRKNIGWLKFIAVSFPTTSVCVPSPPSQPRPRPMTHRWSDNLGGLGTWEGGTHTFWMVFNGTPSGVGRSGLLRRLCLSRVRIPKKCSTIPQTPLHSIPPRNPLLEHWDPPPCLYPRRNVQDMRC